MNEHVILVAVSVTTPLDREGAEKNLHALLRGVQRAQWADGTHIDSWWIAEDERHDESDLDSAVFVHPGHQQEARDLLRAKGWA